MLMGFVIANELKERFGRIAHIPEPINCLAGNNLTGIIFNFSDWTAIFIEISGMPMGVIGL